ncbi:MAG: hypothetical protein R3240_02815, partial [Gammaproteobacteria bacterium]|nr:hypothetical protein [Gammaproteobacteria bacterium]
MKERENIIVIGQPNTEIVGTEQESDNQLYASLSQALIQHCRQDGNDASRLLSVKLSNINSELSALQEKINQCATSEELSAHVQTALGDVVETFLELQFFDRVSQRLEHAMSAVDYALEPDKAV